MNRQGDKVLECSKTWRWNKKQKPQRKQYKRNMETGKKKKKTENKAEVKAKEYSETVILKGNIKLLQMLLKCKLRCGHRNNN